MMPLVLSLHQNPPSSLHRLSTDRRLNLICPAFPLLHFSALKFSSWEQRPPVHTGSLPSLWQYPLLPAAWVTGLMCV